MFSLCVLSTVKGKFQLLSQYKTTGGVLLKCPKSRCCPVAEGQVRIHAHAAIFWEAIKVTWETLILSTNLDCFWFWKITIIQSQLTSSYVGKCFKIVIQHIERGTLRKLCVFHFITMIMLMLAMFFVVLLICFMEQVFQRLGNCWLKVGIRLIVHLPLSWWWNEMQVASARSPLLMCCIAIVLWVTRTI